MRLLSLTRPRGSNSTTTASMRHTPQPTGRDTWKAETVSTLASPPQRGRRTHHCASSTGGHVAEYYSAVKKVSMFDASYSVDRPRTHSA